MSKVLECYGLECDSSYRADGQSRIVVHRGACLMSRNVGLNMSAKYGMTMANHCSLLLVRATGCSEGIPITKLAGVI